MHVHSPCHGERGSSVVFLVLLSLPLFLDRRTDTVYFILAVGFSFNHPDGAMETMSLQFRGALGRPVSQSRASLVVAATPTLASKKLTCANASVKGSVSAALQKVISPKPNGRPAGKTWHVFFFPLLAQGSSGNGLLR